MSIDHAIVTAMMCFALGFGAGGLAAVLFDTFACAQVFTALP